MFTLNPFAAKPLRLRAEDAGDLQILAATVQDAIGLVGDIVYDSTARRFALPLNRFRWERGTKAGPSQRVRAILGFDSVLGAQFRGVRRSPPGAALVLLTLGFAPRDAADPENPAGTIVLTFAGGGEIRLDVECVDATLADISRPWPAKSRPRHGAGAS